jgi:uncharacterized protein YbaP (TraB family)
MRRKLVSVITALFTLYAGWHAMPARADDALRAEATTSAAPTRQAAAIRHGTLYRVEYRGHTSYLFGTVHVGQAAFYPLEPQVTRALDRADRLVIEVDIRDAAAFGQAIARYGLYPQGQTIAQHLSADTLEKLQGALQRAGIPFDRIARMKPWMVANLLIVQEMARNGFPAEQGIEMYLLSVAQKQGKAVGALETADYQLSLFDSLNQKQQEDYLRENIAELADGSAMKKGLALIDAWRRADSPEMERLLQDDQSPSSAFMQKLLISRRNPGMAGKIEMLLKNDKASFVALGALHLLGENGVPALLQQRGYRVQKLY